MAPEQALAQMTSGPTCSARQLLYQMRAAAAVSRSLGAGRPQARGRGDAAPIPEIIPETPDCCAASSRNCRKKPRIASSRPGSGGLLADCEAKLKAKQR